MARLALKTALSILAALVLLLAGCGGESRPTTLPPLAQFATGLGAGSGTAGGDLYYVTIDVSCYLSLWPWRAVEEMAPGWQDFGYQGSAAACEAYIKEVWELAGPDTQASLKLVVDDRYQLHLSLASAKAPAGWRDFGFKGDYYACCAKVTQVFADGHYHVIRQGSAYAIQSNTASNPAGWSNVDCYGTIGYCRAFLWQQGVGSYTVKFR